MRRNNRHVSSISPSGGDWRDKRAVRTFVTDAVPRRIIRGRFAFPFINNGRLLFALV